MTDMPPTAPSSPITSTPSASNNALDSAGAAPSPSTSSAVLSSPMTRPESECASTNATTPPPWSPPPTTSPIPTSVHGMPPTVREILHAYGLHDDASKDRTMLMDVLRAKSAEDQRIAALANLAIIQIQHTILLQRSGHASSSSARPLNILATSAQTSILPSESSVSASGVARKHRGASDAEVNTASSLSSSPALLGAQCQDEVRRSHAASSSARPMSPPISHLRPSPPRHRPSPPSPYEVPSRSNASSSSSSVSPPTQTRPLSSAKASTSGSKSTSTAQPQLRQYPPNPSKKPSAPGASRKPLAHLLAPLPTHSSLYLSSRRQKSGNFDSADGQSQPPTRSPPLHLSMHQNLPPSSRVGSDMDTTMSDGTREPEGNQASRFVVIDEGNRHAGAMGVEGT